MSKKIMKRSLALGALMAFVITGSAMSVAEAATYQSANGKPLTVEKTNATYPDKEDYYVSGYGERVVGGWTSMENVKDTVLNSNITVEGGEFNAVIGGNRISGVVTDMTVKSTNVTIDGATVKQLIGGTEIQNVNDEDIAAGRTTNITINSGYLGTDNDNTNCPEKHIVAGDMVKLSEYKKPEGIIGWTATATSVIENTNLNINGGTFDAAVYGGSAAVRTYAGSDEGGLSATVNKANVNITGGTFNEVISAGGLAWKKDTKSIVNESYININGDSGKLTFGENADIYAGGFIDGTFNKDAQTATVGKAVITIENATVSDIYGTGGKIGVTSKGGSHSSGSGSNWSWTYAQNTDTSAIVNTDLSLSNVTANTIDLPKGTLTLAGTNKVNNMTIGADVTEVNIASKALNEGSSLTGDGTGSLIVEGEKTTKLTITGITAGTYNIASGYATNEANKFVFDQKDELLDAKAVYDEQNKIYKVEVTAKSAGEIADKLETSESTGNFVKDIITDGNDEAKEFLDKLTASDASNAVINETLNAVQKMGEAGGNSATAANIVKNVTGVTNDRLSFNCGHSAPHKGGHGVGLFEEGSGADIWVEYVHGKDEVEDMPSTAGASSYEGQYNGIVMGVDFKKVGKFQSGIAFNYGEGDTNSVGSATRTHSDYDFWGVGYYGNIHNDDSNVIFDINYAQTDSDVTQSSATAGTLEASPETTTWSAGVKLEKLYQNENVQIVPYTGLRYMSIDSDDYSTSGGEFYYSMERQNIWLLPVGVSIRQEIANDNGWTVSPRVDLSYIWAFGDTNSNMEVKVGNGITPIGYDVMDDGSFLGLVGIEAHKGQWGYGIAYSYQKGDHSESKKWYVDVNYSF